MTRTVVSLIGMTVLVTLLAGCGGSGVAPTGTSPSDVASTLTEAVTGQGEQPHDLVGRIAFVNSWGTIWTVKPDGTGQAALTPNALWREHPAWSPDGTRIAFERKGGLNTRIWVMNADGTGLQEVSGAAGDDSAPAWSPDGLRIAYSHYRNGSGEIYVMNADGTGAHRLTRATTVAPPGLRMGRGLPSPATARAPTPTRSTS